MLGGARLVAAAALAASGTLALAADFRTVTADAAVLYDAPSARSNKLFVVNRGYPLEVVVAVEGWVKQGFCCAGPLGGVESQE